MNIRIKKQESGETYIPIPFFIVGIGVLMVLLTIPLRKETLLRGSDSSISIGGSTLQPRFVLIKSPLSDRSPDMLKKVISRILLDMGILLLIFFSMPLFYHSKA